jgi:hypothetical protein
MTKKHVEQPAPKSEEKVATDEKTIDETTSRAAVATPQNLPALNDGFEDEEGTADRVIVGTLIKFGTDAIWKDRIGAAVPANLQLLAVACTAVVQRWGNRKPIQTIMKPPGQKLPDVDALNKEVPRAEWEPGPDGQPKPPWQHQLVVYLLDEKSAEKFTFASGTIGARIAVDDLKDRIRTMRSLRGEHVVPVVKLTSKPFPTKYGMKARPSFEIIDWRQLGVGIAHDTPRQIEHAKSEMPRGIQPVEPPTVAEEVQDEIVF